MKNAIIIFAFAALTGCASVPSGGRCATSAQIAGLEHRLYAVEDGQGIHECVCSCPHESASRSTRKAIEAGKACVDATWAAARAADRIRDLEMENAALKAINQELTGIRCEATECTGIIKVRRTLARGQDEP